MDKPETKTGESGMPTSEEMKQLMDLLRAQTAAPSAAAPAVPAVPVSNHVVIKAVIGAMITAALSSGSTGYLATRAQPSQDDITATVALAIKAETDPLSRKVDMLQQKVTETLEQRLGRMDSDTKELQADSKDHRRRLDEYQDKVSLIVSIQTQQNSMLVKQAEVDRKLEDRGPLIQSIPGMQDQIEANRRNIDTLMEHFLQKVNPVKPEDLKKKP